MTARKSSRRTNLTLAHTWNAANTANAVFCPKNYRIHSITAKSVILKSSFSWKNDLAPCGYCRKLALSLLAANKTAAIKVAASFLNCDRKTITQLVAWRVPARNDVLETASR
jgi:hypothetical protein